VQIGVRRHLLRVRLMLDPQEVGSIPIFKVAALSVKLSFRAIASLPVRSESQLKGISRRSAHHGGHDNWTDDRHGFHRNGRLFGGCGSTGTCGFHAMSPGSSKYQNASVKEAFFGLTFTWQGRRTEKLQSGRRGMLRRVSMIQYDAIRRINTNAAAATFDLIRCRYSSTFASSAFRRKGITLLELAGIKLTFLMRCPNSSQILLAQKED
jgi:hypothetical protein